MRSGSLIMILIFFASCKTKVSIIPYNSDEIPNDSYCKDLDNELDKFIGIWKYEADNESFEIRIVKNKKVNLDSYYIDELAGNFKFIKEEIILVNTLSNNYKAEAAFSGDDLSENGNKFALTLADPRKPRASYRLELKYLKKDINSSTERIEWVLAQNGFFSGYIPGEKPPSKTELDQTMRLPKKLILIKQ